MDSTIKVKFRRGQIELIERFGRELNIGDYILIATCFLDNNILNVPVCVLKETGLCWYDKATESYIEAEDGFYIDEGDSIYVYKMNPGEKELELINNANKRNNNLKKSDEKKLDIFSRNNYAGALALCCIDENIKYAEYAIFVSYEEVFNGYYRNYIYEDYYIISEPAFDELEIRSHLNRKFNKYMQQKIIYNIFGKKRGDYFLDISSTSGIYIYLGKSPIFADREMYLCFEYNYFCLGDTLFEILENDGLGYILLNYLKERDLDYVLVVNMTMQSSVIDKMNFNGHIGVTLTDNELLEYMEKVYTERIGEIEKIRETGYKSKIVLEKAYFNLCAFTECKYKRMILRMTRKFKGDIDDYNSSCKSILKRCEKEKHKIHAWYYKELEYVKAELRSERKL